jgi:hypothetical protein
MRSLLISSLLTVMVKCKSYKCNERHQFSVFLRTVAVDQTALEVGFAGVLHRTGVCGCARVCISGIFITGCNFFFFVNTNMHMGV